MHNKFFYILCLACLAGVVVACGKADQDLPSSIKPSISFTARILDTKTTLMDGVKTYWTPTDKILVYDGTHTDAIFGNSLLGNSAEASFTLESGTIDEEAAEYRAVYPSTTVGGWKDGNPSFTIPANQTAVCNGIADGLDVLMASSETKSFDFNHACAALTFAIGNNSAQIKRVEVTASVSFAGRWRYLFSENKTDTSSGIVQSESKTITLKKEDDSVFEKGNYYVMIPARNYSDGLEVTFVKNDDSEVTIQTPKLDARTMEGVIYSMGEVNSLTSVATAPSVGDACGGGICAYVRDAHSAIVLSLDQAPENGTYASAIEWVATKGGDWRLPTYNEYLSIRSSITGKGSYVAETSKDNFDTFNGKITDLGGTSIHYSDGYWTGTLSEDKVYAFKFFNNSVTGFGSNSSPVVLTGSRPTRAVRIVYF